MSVILFAKSGLYQDMADSYEGLKPFMVARHGIIMPDEDAAFYTALRRLYFANVAAYLCTYHDETPLRPEELTAIDPFVAMHGHADPSVSTVEQVYRFIHALRSLTYNLVTNAGEEYIAKNSLEYMEGLARRFTLALFEEHVA